MRLSSEEILFSSEDIAISSEDMPFSSEEINTFFGAKMAKKCLFLFMIFTIVHNCTFLRGNTKKYPLNVHLCAFLRKKYSFLRKI